MRPIWKDIEAHVEAALLAAPRGDIVEIGVFHGDTAARLAVLAAKHDRDLYAIDSFEGMAEPGEHDINADGRTVYPRGSMSTGGGVGFNAVSRRLAAIWHRTHTIRGWVPEVLASVPGDTDFAFVVVDLDHYKPTLDALRWAWLRMLPGGVLCCHDWFPGSGRLASRAFEEFCDDINATPQGPTASRYGMVLR